VPDLYGPSHWISRRLPKIARYETQSQLEDASRIRLEPRIRQTVNNLQQYENARYSVESSGRFSVVMRCCSEFEQLYAMELAT
jgi:hypothetical protein